MRTRAFVVVALLALPAALSAQLRLPRVGRRTSPEPATLPPESPVVTRALAYKRSRWSAESYTLFSSMQAPTGAGVSARYTTLGAGTHADYRYSDRWSGGMDLTVSPYGGATTTMTAEVGTRFSPLPWEEQVRPFFDVRAAYTHMYDEFASPTNPAGGFGNPSLDFTSVSRYSRGFGAVAGAGLDVSLTNTIALSSELTAVRSRMRAYRVDGAAGFPNAGPNYWLTSVRLSMGIKYSPVRALRLAQTVTH
jgi:hypothetical protein